MTADLKIILYISYLHTQIQLLLEMQNMDNICFNSKKKSCLTSMSQIKNVLLHLCTLKPTQGSL